ncbi:MAG: hypothetical protein R3E09_01875 [Novosphingobium sp.]
MAIDIAVLDPAVGRKGRPHFDEVLEIAGSLVRLGARVTVHGHSSIDEAMATQFRSLGAELKPSFSDHDFAPPRDTMLDIETWRKMIRTVATELAALPEPDVAFWPALMPTQAQAIARAPKGRLIVAGLDGQLNVRGPFSPEIFGDGARRMAPLGDRFVLGAYDRRLVEPYRPYFGNKEIINFPNPYRGAPKVPRTEGEPLRIGILGALRPERGRGLVPGLVEGLLERGLKVVVQSSFMPIPEMPRHPNLELLDFVADFPALVASCDLVLWPSTARLYAYRASGIAWVAIASGVPMVMPSTCLPAQIVAEHGAASFFHFLQTQFVLRAVDTAVENYSGLSALALIQAEKWNRSQGPDHLARLLLEIARSRLAC